MSGYFVELAASQGLQSRTLRALVEEVFAEPTDARWRVLASIVNSIRLGLTLDCEAYAACVDLLAILAVEREWAYREGPRIA